MQGHPGTLPDREIVTPALTKAGSVVPDWARERAIANDLFRRPTDQGKAAKTPTFPTGIPRL